MINKVIIYTDGACSGNPGYGGWGAYLLYEDNKKKIWKLIQKTGDELIGRLPDHPSHPKGRNPYAHIALEIKNHFGMSYKDIEDDKIPELEKFIEFIQNNPR